MEHLKYDGCQALEIRVPGVTAPGQTIQTWGFGSQDFLRDKLIVAIEVYTENAITGGPLTGTTVCTTTNLRKASLVLQQDGVQVVQRVPLVRLNNVTASTDPYSRTVFTVNETIIDWQNSSVQFNAAPLNTTDFVVVFGVYWKYQ